MERIVGDIIFAVFLLAFTASAIDLQISNNHYLTVNSSLVRDTVVISVSSRGPPGSSYWMSSPCFSEQERHKFIHGAGKFTLFPEVEEHNVVFNDYASNEYWLTLRKWIDTE